MNSVELSLFASRVAAICDEMGLVLRRTAFSPNIKDRLDFSCALFDPDGELCAQAAHIPVHLGSMAYAMRQIVRDLQWGDGDMLILNDPYLGGTHLPDVTLIAPVFDGDGQLVGFAANRAHHADIGCETPGSMPISRTLNEEGIVIPPTWLLRSGQIQADAKSLPGVADGSLGGDLAAQVGANQIGVLRLRQLVDGLRIDRFRQAMCQLNDYAERLVAGSLKQLSPGNYQFSDWLDDDGCGNTDIQLRLNLQLEETRAVLDFSDCGEQVAGNLNCPEAVVAAAVYYCFRCLMPGHTPACAGTFRPLHIQTRPGTIVNARRPAAVAAGNVETSMRLVDLVFGALAQAIPGRIPAASQGTMNNLAMGYVEAATGRRWDYYETLAGGHGGSPNFAGISAAHSHMTNTLNTPIESLEMHYPLRVTRYSLRDGSGGRGKNYGGDGVVREYEFLAASKFTLLSERRRLQPWGLYGGEPGQSGAAFLNNRIIPGKYSTSVGAGDRLRIETPGGGGWGRSDPASTAETGVRTG